MLKSLPTEALRHRDPFFAMLAEMDSGSASRTSKLDEGVYQSHLNWNHEIERYIKRDGWVIWDDGKLSLQERAKLIPAYGVCDTWEQIVEKYPDLISDPRPVLIRVTPMVKADQSPEGGWRWHKWGEYIGVKDPQCEYLYDEDDSIEKVYVYHIYELL